MQTERAAPGAQMWEGWEAGFRAGQARRPLVVGGTDRSHAGRGAKTLEPHLVLGPPDAAIVWLADEIEAGLVVVESRGHGRMRAVVGSVSDSVVHDAH